MQEMQVRSLGREGPTCHGTIKPVCHNYWACALEPASHNCRRPLPRARALEQERPLPWEVWAPQWESSLHSPRLEKKPCGGKDPAQPKINLKIKKKKNRKTKKHGAQNTEWRITRQKKHNWCQSPLGSFECRWVPRDEEVTVYWRTQIYGLCPHTGRGREPKARPKAGHWKDGTFVKKSPEKWCTVSRKEARKSFVFLVLWWKRPQWEILTLSLLKGRVWRFKIFTQGTEIPTLISDLWSHQSLHWHKGQPSL